MAPMLRSRSLTGASRSPLRLEDRQRLAGGGPAVQRVRRQQTFGELPQPQGAVRRELVSGVLGDGALTGKQLADGDAEAEQVPRGSGVTAGGHHPL